MLPKRCIANTKVMLLIESRVVISSQSLPQVEDVVHELGGPVLHARMFPNNGDRSQQSPGAKVEEVDRQGSESKLQAVSLDSCGRV